MLELPRNILKSLENNKTSLGEHPSFPPEEEEKFTINAVARKFTSLIDGIEITDIEAVKGELGKLITECKKIENKHKDALEELCVNIVTELFSIPENTISLNVRIVDEVNDDNVRFVPEKTEDFSFDSIDDMKNLGDEVYKRRMLNALIVGAAMYYSDNISAYIKELFDIDRDLPSLYSKIMRYNEILMFFEKESLNEDDAVQGGKVDVTMNTPENSVSIEAEGVIFPALLEETIKGILELAISHGLPEKREKAEYVIKKSDFKLAELWDMRLGFSLWDIIISQLEEMDNVEPNFFFMTLSEMPVDAFNDSLREIFAKTRKGKEILNDLVEDIISQKQKDEFDDFIRNSNDEYSNRNYQMNDGYFTSEELITDSESDPFEINEGKKKQRKNDKGEIVPEKCDKCGSKVGLYLQGEPIYKCSNKKCGKFFGTMPFK